METRTRTGDMPRGTVRPDIPAPDVDDLPQTGRQADQRHVWLTAYRFRDESAYTHEVFDYRLRWTLFASHRTMRETNGRGPDTEGWATATLEVWSRRDNDWHQVWEISRAAVSPYSVDRLPKLVSWNAVLSELADRATVVLL